MRFCFSAMRRLCGRCRWRYVSRRRTACECPLDSSFPPSGALLLNNMEVNIIPKKLNSTDAKNIPRKVIQICLEFGTGLKQISSRFNSTSATKRHAKSLYKGGPPIFLHISLGFHFLTRNRALTGIYSSWPLKVKCRGWSIGKRGQYMVGYTIHTSIRVYILLNIHAIELRIFRLQSAFQEASRRPWPTDMRFVILQAGTGCTDENDFCVSYAGMNWYFSGDKQLAPVLEKLSLQGW